ncbi:hypothetical protein RvY_04413 [Ramazzottius varieornatus]|uniref:Uncharacterized protein n=1 Tax=Ramazzottius varieornatus TaxID=947166 RepID=A0A1D1UYC9_RAMVA|nr:hypothetical protein RvY_04413 [Ramazzottius varieornatus]
MRYTKPKINSLICGALLAICRVSWVHAHQNRDVFRPVALRSVADKTMDVQPALQVRQERQGARVGPTGMKLVRRPSGRPGDMAKGNYVHMT